MATLETRLSETSPTLVSDPIRPLGVRRRHAAETLSKNRPAEQLSLLAEQLSAAGAPLLQDGFLSERDGRDLAAAAQVAFEAAHTTITDSPHHYYMQVAFEASVRAEIDRALDGLRGAASSVEGIILVGGCALNVHTCNSGVGCL